MKIYDIILESWQADEIANRYENKDISDGTPYDGAIAYAQGLDFSEIEIIEQNIKYKTYMDTINGIEVYYDYGADYFFFAPVED